MLFLLSLITAAGLSDAAVVKRQATSVSIPVGILATSPDPYPGPTATGSQPFLAQTNPAPLSSYSSYAPPRPLQTQIPIQGNTNNSNIFELVGQLSSYFPNPDGFGANEYPIPPGANVSMVNLLHRHGSRYPTSSSGVASFGALISSLARNGTASFNGSLAFLNTWTYKLGAEILVPRGRQELFDSGVQFYYQYAHLYNTSSKLISRTTTQDRMLKSAENFMAGMFGLEWVNNATLIDTWEQSGFNNSLAGYFDCPNNNNFRSAGGTNASIYWENIYLQAAQKRIQSMTTGYNWTISDVYNAQTMCPYEEVAFGYSQWCDLFTFSEWQAFEYSIDLSFQGSVGWASPTGRGVGIGYAEELYARLQGHLYNLPPGSTNVNTTDDSNNITFPLNQTIYMDFSHDTNMWAILTALDMRQFSDKLSNSSITPRNATVSHITPFGARFVWEIINAPQPLAAKRPTSSNATMASYYLPGNATKYVHMTISQRTVPLGASYPECGMRDDGYCEFGAFMTHLSGLLTEANYTTACFGNYSAAPWNAVTNGAPIKRGIAPMHDALRKRKFFHSGLEYFGNSDELMNRF